MPEYISREAVEQVLCGIANGLSVGEAEALKTKDIKALYKIKGAKEILNAIDNDLCFIPAADVQPVNRWISVKDRLPENEKPCAVVTENNGLGVSRYMGRNRFEWTLFGERVLHWMPLPEPSKDGDAE